jgi:NADP-reducing hydrogenase subunit HndD
MEVKVAVASGLANAKLLLNKVKSGEASYHFIEIMGCPGGCVNGGGQPQVPASIRNFSDVRALRAKVLYDQDSSSPVRKSHENEGIQKLYKEYLGAPGSHKAHKLLHTTYVKRSIN